MLRVAPIFEADQKAAKAGTQEPHSGRLRHVGVGSYCGTEIRQVQCVCAAVFNKCIRERLRRVTGNVLGRKRSRDRRRIPAAGDPVLEDVTDHTVVLPFHKIDVRMGNIRLLPESEPGSGKQEDELVFVQCSCSGMSKTRLKQGIVVESESALEIVHANRHIRIVGIEDGYVGTR